MSKKPEVKIEINIALIVLGLAALYILATNIVTTIIALFLFGIAILVALYFILPILGVSGIAGLLAIIGLGKR